MTRQVLTGSGTYTRPVGCTAILVECVGDGGGGGGTPATTGTGAGQNAAGGGGGGGAYAASLIANPAASYTYACGTGGTGVSGAGGNNGAGTVFGSNLVVAAGGHGASVAVRDVGIFPDTSGANASGGLAAGCTGDLILEGGAGFGGILLRLGFPYAGGGGDAARGGGQRLSGPSNGTFAGQAGKQYGGGGGGASAITSAAAQTGGNGAAGVIIVTEYY